MNILVVSNLYPPYVVGGYELGCHDVVRALRARGHTLHVLTSSYGLRKPSSEPFVARWLETEIGWNFAAPSTGLRLFRKELRNRRAMRRALKAFRPDLVYVWSLQYLSVSPVLIAQSRGLPVCFYSSDEWLSRWELRDRWHQTPHAPARRRVKRALDRLADAIAGPPGPRALDLRHVECTSAYIRDAFARAGKPTHAAQVIPWGIDLARFPYRAASPPLRTRLLYVGQLIEHKGVHTAIMALKRLVEQGVDATLTVVGGAASQAYQRRLELLAEACGGRVRFTGALPREQLAAVYAGHDILIFPSIWQEPFSITLLEALASGLAVVSTSTGGTPEILSDERNALLFEAEDAQACAERVSRLVADAMLYERLRRCGRADVEQRYQLARMVDQIERHLLQVVT